ncbi:hypothetical protein N9D66_01775 [Candidatus Nanopelagicales bacterium]|nr:hypothetical protein [Candidatus Nanopelagicales bacterium]
MSTKVTAKTTPTSDLSETDLEALEEIRLRAFHSDGSRTPATDLEHFRELIRSFQLITVVHEGDAPQGMILWSWDVLKFGSRQVVWFRAEDYIMAPDVRGGKALPLAAARVVTRMLATTNPLKPIYCVAPAYPGSYIMLRDVFGRVATLQDSPTDFERELILAVGEQTGGDRFEPKTGLKSEHLSPSDQHRRLKHTKHEAEFDHYEQMNPQWREGYALFVCVKASRVTFVPRLLRTALRRRRAHGGH